MGSGVWVCVVWGQVCGSEVRCAGLFVGVRCVGLWGGQVSRSVFGGSGVWVCVSLRPPRAPWPGGLAWAPVSNRASLGACCLGLGALPPGPWTAGEEPSPQSPCWAGQGCGVRLVRWGRCRDLRGLRGGSPFALTGPEEPALADIWRIEGPWMCLLGQARPPLALGVIGRARPASSDWHGCADLKAPAEAWRWPRLCPAARWDCRAGPCVSP